MRKRITSLFLVLALCLTMLPATALAEDASPAGQEMQSSTDVSDGYTIDEDTTLQDEEENDAAVQAAQALIDALPDEATAENAEALETKLIAIDKALALLTDEQREKLDMTRYEALCEAMTTLTAEQEGEHKQANEHSHPICGDVSCTKHGGSLTGWVGVSELSDDMEAGYYYLTGPVTRTSTWYPKDGVVLCLNGYNISMDAKNSNNDSTICVNGGVTFTLCDCQNKGTVTHGMNGTAKYIGSGVWVESGNGAGEANFVLYSGSVSGNEYDNASIKFGAGVHLGANASFTMHGGSISDNKTAGYGGGVYVQARSTSFTMTGGTIAENSAGHDGGGVYVKNGAFTMTGGSITDNTVGNGCNGGGVYAYMNANVTLSGAPVITGNNDKSTTVNNVYLNKEEVYGEGKTLIGNGGLSSTASIGVTVDADKLPTTDGSSTIIAEAAEGYTITADDAKRVSADAGTGYNVRRKDNTLVLFRGELPHEHPICGATCGHTDSTHPDVEWTAISDLSTITAGTESAPNYYYLTKNIELTTEWNAPQYTVLDLNGYSITMQQEGDAIKVTGSFTLTDCKGGKTEYGKITHKTGVNGRGVNVSEDCTFTMYGGSITGNTMTDDGGGIWAANKAVITMYDGEISGNKTTGEGGGVYLYNATLEMSGSASITKNITTESSGGGVCAVMGKIKMSDKSSISNNTASDSNGGGVFLSGYKCTLTMSDEAEIANNKAKANAAGVYMYGDEAQFTMDGGSIYGNEFTETGNCSGGGVYIGEGTFTMNSGSIYNNKAPTNGGGVCSNGMFNMNGGNIYGNTATNGGGVYMYGSDKRFTMNDGNIYGNTATGNGGGVYISNGTFTMTKGTIGAVTLNRVNYDGNSAKNGGGVYINDGTFTMGTGESQTPNIYSNTASGQGGGVYVRSGQGTHFQIFNSVQVWNNGNSDVYLDDNQTIQIIGKLVGDKTIGVTPSSLPTTNPITFADGKGYTLTDDDAAPFFVNNHYGDNMYSIQLEGDHLKLYLGQPHKHTVCVGTDCTDSTHTNAFFSALSYDANTKQLVYDGNRSSNQISGDARYLYLQDDIKINETIEITENSNVTICLNGHSITSTANGNVIKIENGATLTLCDCRGGDETAQYGKITHDRSAQGRGVYVPAGATFTMYSGEISGNTLTSNSYGAGVFTEGTTTICGNAKITNNYANAPRGYGGGICTTGSLMLGGNAEITNNYVGYSNNGGGGIFADQGSRLFISGNVKVSENMSASGSCNLYLNHNEYDTAPITVTGELADTARIGVTMVESQRPTDTNPSVSIAKAMTAGWIKDGNFVSDYNFYQMGVATLPNEQLAQLRLHDHTWGVRVKSATEANILERYCTAFTNCPSTGGTLTLIADDATFNGTAYAGASVLTDDWTISAQDLTIFYTNSIGGTAIEAPIKAGTYYANVTVDGVTATKEFKISRYKLGLNAGDFDVVVPKNPTYDGDPKTVTKAEFKNDSIKQWFGEITVKYYDYDTGDPVDKPTDAGTYGVKLDVAAGDGYEAQTDITCDDWKFTINQVQQELHFTYPTVNKMYGEASFTNPLKETDIQGTITYTSSNENVAKVAADGTVTILAATEGTVTITARTEGTTNYSSAEASFTLTVAKKGITVSGITAKDKYYDKTANATLDYSGVQLDGKLGSDELGVTATGAFENANAGEGKTVEITGLTLTGAAVGNYILLNSGQQTSTTATIKKMPLEIVRVTGIKDKDYDGDAGLSHVEVLFEDVNQKRVAVAYAINAHFPDADADETNVDVTADVKLVFGAEENYELTNSPYTVPNAAKINKIVPICPTGLTGYQGNALSTMTLPDGWMWKNEATVMNETGSNKEFSAHYAGDTNHKAGDYTVTVTVSAKRGASLGNFAQPACTYGETLPDATYDTVDGVTKTTIQYTGTANDGTTYGPSSDKPMNAGNYIVTVTCETLNTIYTGTANFTIAKKPIDLDVTLDCGEGFVYDGMAKEPGVTVNFKDTTTPLPTDEYTVSYSNNIDASIGNRDGIVTIASTRTGNYIFGAGYYHFNIAPKKLTMGASVTEKKYDGLTDAVVKHGALVGIVNSDDVCVVETSVSGNFNNEFVGTGKSVTLSENFTLTGSKASNYTLTQPTVTGNIIAADQTPAITDTARISRGGKTLDLSGLVSGAQGTVAFEISAGGEYAALSGSTLTTKDNVGTVKITVKIGEVDLNSDGKPEYNAYTGTDAITVSVTLKETSTVTAAPTAIPDLVYKGSNQALITAGTATGGTLYYKLNNGTYSKDLPTAQDAGDYTVYYKVVGDDDHENTEERSFTVTIRKAAVTITARDKSAYVGGTVPVLPVEPVKDTDYTISEMYGTDTLEGNVTLTYDGTPDMSKAGSTVIKISGTLANDNYTITYVNGKLTVNRRSSGGGSSSSNSSANAISTSGKSDNGSISTDKPTAKKGDTVTIIVTPESGYKLDKLTVTDSKGNTLTVTDKGDGKYTFTMPDSKVTVIPTFAKETEVNPFTDVSTDAYYYKAVKWAQEKEITGGIGNDLFGPDAACTRAQIVTFLWRAAGSPEPKSMSSFSDVPADSYYAKAVAWAVENGITTGTGDGKFSPEATCTRAQSVTFLCRAVGKPFEGEVVFSDVPADSYYANAVAWAVKNKVTNGVAEGLFGPDNSCTRAQIVTFLYRTYQG